MAVPVPSTFYAGQRWRAADVNTEIRANLNWTLAGKTCRAKRTTAQSISDDGNYHSILFNTEDFDILAWHNNSTFPNLIVPNLPGYYAITGSVDFEPRAAHLRAHIRVKSYSTVFDAAAVGAPGNASYNTALSLSTVVYLNGVDNYAELVVYQKSTGASLSTSVDYVTPTLCVTWIGS